MSAGSSGDCEQRITREEMWTLLFRMRSLFPGKGIVFYRGGFEIGVPTRDARACEARPEDNYIGGPWDDGIHLYEMIRLEQEGKGLRAIWTGMDAIHDHLLPECPAVRRRRKIARYCLGLVDIDDDPHGDVCGWCKRVWRSRHAADSGVDRGPAMASNGSKVVAS